MSKKKNFPSYEEAKKIVIENGIKSVCEYKTKRKELGIPTNPDSYYKDMGWTNWIEFYGGEKKSFPLYEEAKKIVMENGIKSYSEYKIKYKELGLPTNPNSCYKNMGWTNWIEFFGGEKKSFPSYEDAKKIVIENGIKSCSEYKIKYREFGLPSVPQSYYKNMGWTNWIEFFGGEKKPFPSYEDAKKIVMEIGIQSSSEYEIKYSEFGLPSAPQSYYKNMGWTNWIEFFGGEKKSFPSYEDAKKIVMENSFKNRKDYKIKHKELGLPSHPESCYKNIGWTNWQDYLGKSKRNSSSERKFKVLTSLAINPILLRDDTPLQVIYMIASQLDKKLANEIEGLLNCTSCEDKLNWVKEQLKSLKPDTTTIPKSKSVLASGELSAMESVMEVFEDSLDDLSEDDSAYINSILKNYYHNAINKELIAEFDD